jgi:hypothetical protein
MVGSNWCRLKKGVFFPTPEESSSQNKFVSDFVAIDRMFYQITRGNEGWTNTDYGKRQLQWGSLGKAWKKRGQPQTNCYTNDYFITRPTNMCWFWIRKVYRFDFFRLNLRLRQKMLIE